MDEIRNRTPPKNFSTTPNLSDRFGFMHSPVKSSFCGLFCAAITFAISSLLLSAAAGMAIARYV